MKAVISFVVVMCVIGLMSANAATKGIEKSTSQYNAKMAAALASAE